MCSSSSLVLSYSCSSSVFRLPIKGLIGTSTIGTSTGLTVAGQANAAIGNDSYHLYNPTHMAFDSNDNMYVSDRTNSRVQFFTRGNLSGTTVAGITGN